MSILTANKLSKFYGGDEIFSNITVEVPQKARIALVGPNGAGKTTLVNLLIGAELPSEGNIHVSKGAHMAYLPQRPEMVGTHNLWDEQLKAFDDLRAMEAELAALAEDMADPDQHDAALAKYGPLQEEFERLGGYDYTTRIKMVLSGVGFSEDDYHTSLAQLSGGQKTRALLARLLLEQPDLLLLDEPTNHLDIYAVEWLENYLRDFPGAVLCISHDRYFIDNFANFIWELEFGGIETYRGNYTHYLTQRDERRERLQKEYESQQAFIAKEQDYIRKHMGSRWTAQAKGRLKKLETLRKRGKIIERGPQHRQQMRLQMQANDRSGDKVVMTKALRVGYDVSAPLFDVPDLTLWRGETAAIIGPNGAGKSTFLKTLIGQLEALSGHSKLGANVKVGYFAQAHELLQENNNLIDEITRVQPMQLSEVRNYLSQFMFGGDDVFRPIHSLSGGERGRVALAKLALDGANLLLLDEPTNHLDIDSQEILETVLDDFSGTILLVSHDRYLIKALATQVWAVADGTMEVFEGTYEEYVAARNQRREQAADHASTNGKDSKNGRKKSAQVAQKKHGLNPHQLKKRIAELERRIETLETHIDALNAHIAQASAAGDANKIYELGQQYVQAEADLEQTMAEWEKFVE